MKKYLTLGLFYLMLAATLFSCKKTNSGGGNTVSLTVSLSKSSIENTNFDFVDITVKDTTGADVTANCILLLNNTTTISNSFSSSKIGSYTITARKGNESSSPQTLNVVASSPSPFTQKILLEDCTGAWCGYCPRIAYSLSQYKATHPNCIAIAVHGGSSGNDPFKFQYYTTYNSNYRISGYPSAVFNRKKQPDGTYEWDENQSSLNAALQSWAPLGLAINSTTSATNVTGTVKVKYNVTTTKAMRIVIALVENGLVYPQENYYSPQHGVTPYLYGGVNPINNFVHDGVLRRTATDLFGNGLNASEQIKNNTVEVPFDIPLSGLVYGGTGYTAIAANSAIVAFVMDASGTGNGVYNVQYAPVGTNKDFD